MAVSAHKALEGTSTAELIAVLESSRVHAAANGCENGQWYDVEGTIMGDGRSFDVVVNWNYRRGDEGIVFAHGGQHFGYVVFVENERLNFHSNANGRMTKLEPIVLGSSSRTFTLRVAAPGKRRWEVGFTIDGVVHAPQGGFMQPFSFLPYEGIDVGMDRRSPVSWEIYQQHGCFPFTGSIVDVTYLPGEFAPDEGAGALQAAIELGLALE